MKTKISKKTMINAIKGTKSAWELIGFLTAELGFAGDEEIEDLLNDLIKREHR